MIWPRLVFLASIMPCFLWLVEARSGPVLLAATLIMTIPASLSNGVSLVCLTESIPKRVRSGSLAIVYAAAIAIFNGTALPLIAQLIKSTGDVLWPGYYLTGFTAVGLVFMAMMRETAPVKVRAS